MKVFLIPAITAAGLMLSSYSMAFGKGDHQDAREAKQAMHCEHRETRGPNLKRLAKRLDLTDAQIQEIKAIRQAARSEAKANRPSADRVRIQQLNPSDANYDDLVADIAASRAAALEQKILRRAEVREKIYAALTPSQQEKMLAMQLKKAQKRKM